MTYLQGIYADLIAAGYSEYEYTDGDQLKADMANRSDDAAFARLYLYWYADLNKISRYPLHGCSAAYIYNSKAEQSDVEQEILSAWIRTMQLSVGKGRYYGQQPADIRRQITAGTKEYAQYYIDKALGIKRTRKKDPDTGRIMTKFERMVMHMYKNIEEMPLGVADTTNRVLNKDTSRFVSDKIERFLEDKSPEYRKVFRSLLEKRTINECDGVEWETKQTEESVAKDIGKPKHVVTSLKARIRKDFAPYWTTEIKPYI